MNESSLNLLWQETKKGNRMAFEKLYLLTIRELSNRAYKIVKDEDKVKDILQESFVALFQKKELLPEDLNIGGYLASVVKYKSLNCLRDLLSEKISFGPAVNMEVLLDEEDGLSHEYAIQKIQNSILELPDRCQNVFVLKYYNNMSYRQIAEKMGISVKTVEKHIHYGLVLLRRKLNKDQLLLVAILVQIVALYRKTIY